MFSCRAKGLRIALLAGALGTLCATHAAHANTNQCLLGPAAVPGLSGPPEWQDFNADGFWRPELHDPRWSGGALQYLSSLPTGGQGSPSQVAMRAVTVGKIMYVSIQALSDDNGPNEQDAVYVAFSQGDLAGAYALAIDLTGGGAVINPPPNPPAGIVVPADNPLPTQLPPASVSYYHADNARTDPSHPTIEPVWGGENDGIPSWLQGARWDRPVLGSPRWAMTLQIDLSATGLNIAGPTNIFLGATVHGSSGDTIVGTTTPKIGTDVDKLDVTPIPKRSDLWPLYDEPGTACTGGITVDPSDIGVWSGTPGVNGGGSLSTQICTGSGCTTAENTFRVTVRHVPNNGGIVPWDVRVRLRLAGWGSQAAYQDDAPWPDIATTPTGTQIALAVLTTDFTTANGWYWAPPVDAGDGTSAITVDYKCTKGGAAFCPQLADMSDPHQAVSVELAVPSGRWPITTAAAYRNMDFTSPAVSGGTGGVGGAPSGGAPSGGTPSGDAGEAEGGSSGESETSNTSGGSPGVAGASNNSSGGSTAGSATQGGVGNASAGGSSATSGSDKGISCGCRVVGRESSKLADLAALFVLGIAVRRRRSRKAQI